MRRLFVTAALLAASSIAPPAFAACRPSASGTFSFDSRLTTNPHRLCRMTALVFEGRACGGPPRWQAVLPCDQVKNTAVSDKGRLISILTPVAKRRDLNAVRVTWKADRWAWVTLDKLAAGKPFTLPAKLSFEGDALEVTADRRVVIPFETVRQMASVLGD